MPLLLQDSFLTSYTPKAMSQEPSLFHPLLLRLRTTPRWFSPLLLVDPPVVDPLVVDPPVVDLLVVDPLVVDHQVVVVILVMEIQEELVDQVVVEMEELVMFQEIQDQQQL